MARKVEYEIKKYAEKANLKVITQLLRGAPGLDEGQSTERLKRPRRNTLQTLLWGTKQEQKSVYCVFSLGSSLEGNDHVTEEWRC